MSLLRQALPGSALAFSVLAAMVFLTSCATRRVENQSPASGVSAPEGDKVDGVPRRSLAPVALVPSKAPKKNQPPAAPTPAISKTEKIIRCVRQGTLVKESDDLLVFTRIQPARNTENSLFEDAATLGRLRRQLNSIDGLPATVSATATVRNATAYIKLNDELPAETSARAIDSALKTEDVGAVHAQLLNTVRL